MVRADAGLYAVGVFLCLLSTSCASNVQEARKNQDIAYCQSIGAAEGPVLAQCVMSRNDERRQRSMALIAAGNQMIQASEPRQMTTTNCQRTITGVTCQTF